MPLTDKTCQNANPTDRANKLSAVVDARVAVTSARNFEQQGTPKRWIDKWLCEHASHYGLHKPDSSLNESAIQETSKISNWKPEGGAGKTSTGHRS